MTRRDREFVAIMEAMNEGFAWYLRDLKDREKSVEPSAFRQVRNAFKTGLLKGILWQMRSEHERRN